MANIKGNDASLTKVWANATVLRKMGSHIESPVKSQDITTQNRDALFKIIMEISKCVLHGLVGRVVLSLT